MSKEAVQHEGKGADAAARGLASGTEEGTLTPALSQGEREEGTLTPALSQGEREEDTHPPALSQGEREEDTHPPAPSRGAREGEQEGEREGEQEGRAGGSEATEVPGDFVCARCGYPSGKSGSVVCPECGWQATAFDVDGYRRWQREIESWGTTGTGDAAKTLRWWMAIIVAYSLGAAVLTRSPVVLVATPVMLTLAVWMSWHAGWLVARLTREDLRPHTLVVWRRSLWRLHLPWLVAPVFVLLAGFAGLLDKMAGAGSGMYWFFGLGGLGMWTVGCLIVFAGWVFAYLRMGRPRLSDSRRPGWSGVVAFVLGAAIAVGAGGVGFGAGVVAAEGVAVWLDLGNIFSIDGDDW